MDDPRLQTNEEWLARFAGETVDRPTGPSKTYFRYLDHRTTRTSSVVLSFESLDGSVEAVKFFNVFLRGTSKKYPAGKRGQFNPPEGGAFRKFWSQSVGKPPSRWSRVHKSMRSHLRPLLFVGCYEKAVDSKGDPYFKLTQIAVADDRSAVTDWSPTGHEMDTDWTPF